jgi:hypothetical protein
MIFTGLKRKSNQLFFNNNWEKLLEKSSIDSASKVKKILLILDEVSSKDEIKNQLLEVLSIPDGKVDMVVFQQKTKKDQDVKDIFTPKNFGWSGKHKGEVVKNILTNKYDLLINYSKVENVYSNLLILYCKAAFKIGFGHLDNRLYDLIINCDLADKSLFNKELRKYLLILKKI